MIDRLFFVRFLAFWRRFLTSGNKGLLAGLVGLLLSSIVKRLVWIFLAVFCTALAQVRPVELLETNQDSCGCCEKPGACGMPDCAVPAVPAQPTLIGAVASVIVRAAAQQAAKPAARSVDRFYSAFVDTGVCPVRVSAPIFVARVAGVPLFKEHCAFLI